MLMLFSAVDWRVSEDVMDQRSRLFLAVKSAWELVRESSKRNVTEPSGKRAVCPC